MRRFRTGKFPCGERRTTAATLLHKNPFLKHRFCPTLMSAGSGGSLEEQPCHCQRSRPASRTEVAERREAQQSRCCTNISSVPSVRRSSTNLWSFCPVSIISAGNVPTGSTRCVSLLGLIMAALEDEHICSDQLWSSLCGNCPFRKFSLLPHLKIREFILM